MTGHSPNTITNYMNFFRELIINTLEDNINMIGEENIIVKIDESKFGRRKYHRGHIVKGVWVVGGIERTDKKKYFVQIVQDRTAETLHDVISKYVASGSIIYTDLQRGYRGITKLNMSHKTVNHSKNFVDPNTGVHTNTIKDL